MQTFYDRENEIQALSQIEQQSQKLPVLQLLLVAVVLERQSSLSILLAIKKVHIFLQHEVQKKPFQFSGRKHWKKVSA